ncbi:uncharacterized protein [Rutidosis leptorrhynchoides]|uniref:uncharacterized protein n=1 Tax=Rutidosis leptorrhynchoides TaxID=125765 RepID=UPI003A998B8E
MNDFNECLNEIEVDDLGSTWFHFTWTKSLKNPNCGTLKKLDRILCNEEFVSIFPQANGKFLPFIVSDHSPIVITLPNGLKRKKKSFRFMNHVATKDDFISTVAMGWNEQISGHKMFQVVTKLKHLKKSLNKLTWDNGNVFSKVKDMKKKAAVIALNEYEKAKADELIVLPIDELGVIFTKVLDTAEANAMVSPISDDEIKGALFDIDDNKASRPDGYSALFFKKAWSVVGQDICDAIKEFFTNGKMLKEINATLIALIPKIDTPNKVSDFRPIACCNVIYKCISKILTNRIKNGLNKLVNVSQSAFIPSRYIIDNILVAQEVLKGYNRSKGIKRCALKIDLQKAYDTVNWDFFQDILVKFGFHD